MSECPKNYTWACQLCSVPCKDYHISKPAHAASAADIVERWADDEYYQDFALSHGAVLRNFARWMIKRNNKLIESFAAVQRQAGREEMSSAEYVLRLISEPDPWYRDMNPKKQVELIRDRARKALADLDKVRKGEKNGR